MCCNEFIYYYYYLHDRQAFVSGSSTRLSCSAVVRQVRNIIMMLKIVPFRLDGDRHKKRCIEFEDIGNKFATEEIGTATTYQAKIMSLFITECRLQSRRNDRVIINCHPWPNERPGERSRLVAHRGAFEYAACI